MDPTAKRRIKLCFESAQRTISILFLEVSFVNIHDVASNNTNNKNYFLFLVFSVFQRQRID